MRMTKLWEAESEVLNISLASTNEGVIVIDLRFNIIGIDRGAEALFKSLRGYSLEVDSAVLPAEIRRILDAQPPAWDGSAIAAHIRIGDGEYICRLFRVQPLNGVMPQPMVTIHLIRAASVNNSLTKVTENYNLTDREREVLEGISLGLSSKTLGDRMNISPNTVNAFLRMIMIKMGVTTRAGIVGKLLEVERGGNGEGIRVMRRGEDGM